MTREHPRQAQFQVEWTKSSETGPAVAGRLLVGPLLVGDLLHISDRPTDGHARVRRITAYRHEFEELDEGMTALIDLDTTISTINQGDILTTATLH